MIEREAQIIVTEQLHRSPAVAILGPRQVGKTTLAKQVAASWDYESLYIDLERPSDVARLRDAELFLQEQTHKLIIIDEIQRKPDLFQLLRSVIDERKANGEKCGQFLLLGSAAIELVQGVSETLAGRITFFDLGPLNILETTSNNSEKLWLRGGFPDSFLASNDRDSFEWRESFIISYLEKDIPALGPRIPSETLRLFWTMLAHNQGQIINKSQIASSLGVSVTTITRYLDLLVDLMLIRPLRPWSGNIKKRLVKSPKYFVRDSGLVHSLLNIVTNNDLAGHPIAGKSWETFIIENILSVLKKGVVPLFYEATGAAEIDLVLEYGSHRRVGIEIKRSLSPKINKGFFSACKDINITDKFLVYAGTENYKYAKDIEVVSPRSILEIIKNFNP